MGTIRRLEALPLLVTKSCTLNSSAPFRRSPKLKNFGAFYRSPCDDILLSPFFHSLLQLYTTINNTTLDQDMNFFLPSANSSVRPKTGSGAGRTLANIKDKNDAVSRRANSFGISTTWRL